MTNNVVRFPSEKIPVKPDNLGLPAMTEEQMDDFATELSSDVTGLLIGALLEDGLTLEHATDQYFKDIALVLESIRSVVYRMYNQKHVLHELSDSIFIIESSDAGMVSVRLLSEEEDDNPGS